MNPQPPTDDAPSNGSRIVDVEHNEARLVSVVGDIALVAIESGIQLAVPFELLSPVGNDTYQVPFSFGGLAVPTVLGTRVVLRGQKPLLWRERLSIDRVPIGKLVSAKAPPPTRIEGDTLVLPLLEEVFVVSRQLRLREEVRITRT